MHRKENRFSGGFPMMLDTIYREGVARIWAEDSSSQQNFVKIISDVRKMKCIDFKKINAFFVPNDDYVATYFPDEIRQPEYGFYNSDGLCFWNNCLLIPIFDVADNVRSVVGFNPFRYTEAKEKQDWSLNYYIYSPNSVFKKGSFLFYLEGVYKKALQDGYLFLTDGVFDAISLASEGFNAAAMMGSSLTPEIVMLLRFIKHVLLVIDNDDAGIKLANSLQRMHSGVTVVTQKHTKDVDDLLKGPFHDEAVRELHKAQNCCQKKFTLDL